jgi:hypothetical protein
VRARRRSVRLGGGIGDAAFFVAWFGFVIVWIGFQVANIVSTFALRESGVHTTAVALSTRSEVWSDEDGTYTVYFTKVGYTVNDKRYVEEISGAYSAGERIQIVYDAENPEKVAHEKEIGVGGTIISFVFLLFGLGMLAFGISFARDWYSS